MNINDFERPEERDYSYGGSWENFTLGDEKRARGRFSRFFLALSLYTLISYAVIFGASFIAALPRFEGNEFLMSSEFTVLINCVAMYMIALPILYLTVFKMKGATRYKAKMPAKEFAMLFFVSYTLMIAGSLIGTAVNEAIGMALGKEITDSTAELISDIPLWLTVAVPVIIGPIVEEFIFRKLLMDKLGTYGDRLAITVSAIAFGLFHGNLSQFFYAVFLGFVLGYIYAKTSNIIYPILMHMLINFVGSVIPLLFMEPLNQYLEMTAKIAEGGTVDMELYARVQVISSIYSFFTLTLIGIGVFILFKRKNRFFLSDRCEIEIPKKRRASVIVLNAGAIIFILFSLASIIFNVIYG